MSIRDEAVNKKPGSKQGEERKSVDAQNSFERHVGRINTQRGEKARSDA